MTSKHAALIVVLLLRALPFARAAETPYSFELRSANSHVVLDIYRELFGARMVVSSVVSNLSARVTTPSVATLDRAHARRVFEQAAAEQAGIVFTELYDGRVSVSYNEFLSHNGKDPAFISPVPLKPRSPPSYTPPAPPLPPVAPPNPGTRGNSSPPQRSDR